MFVQKANPYHDPKSGRFTHSPAGRARSAASGATSYGAAYRPASMRLLNDDGSLNVEVARQIADHPSIIANAPFEGGGFKQDGALVAIRELQGYNGKPHVVREADFHLLSGTAYHRGDEDFAHSEQLLSGAYFGGRGIYGNGTYAARDLLEAAPYAVNATNERGGIISFRMHPDSRVTRASYTTHATSLGGDAERVYRGIDSAAVSGKLTSTQSDILRGLLLDNGRLATALGYDAFKPPSDSGDDFIIVLNRTAMVISDRIE
jgi:hypothetical protein